MLLVSPGAAKNTHFGSSTPLAAASYDSNTDRGSSSRNFDGASQENGVGWVESTPRQSEELLHIRGGGTGSRPAVHVSRSGSITITTGPPPPASVQAVAVGATADGAFDDISYGQTALRGSTPVVGLATPRGSSGSSGAAGDTPGVYVDTLVDE